VERINSKNKKEENINMKEIEDEIKFLRKRKKRKTYLLLKEAPTQILLTLIKEGDEVYLSKLIRDSRLAYSNAYYTLRNLEKLKFIEIVNLDNYKMVRLTDRGRKLVSLIEEILLLTGE
jgi:predicted transcriptional regulator